MSDRSAVLVAVAAIAGALAGRGPAPWVGFAAVGVALAARRPLLLAASVFVLAGALSARAEAGLVAPTPGPFEGWATMLTDTEPSFSGVRADVRLGDGRHVQAVALSRSAAAALRDVPAGERVFVVGRLQRPSPAATWLAVRHVVGVLAVDEVRARSPGPPWVRAANGLRAVLVGGADGLPERQRSLFLGFVLGDTRGQPVDITDDFRGAGLSHLLAVSGQNVAFVLALAGPFLRRLGLSARLPTTLAVIAFFALVTRFEPSVLRASVMAALAVTATTLGREASSIRLLALAIGALVLVDPFLVRSVGFQLSAGACLGIVVLSPTIARALPGPRAVAEAVAVTLAAQVGVAPVLIAVFGGLPVAGLPANLVVAPIAGPVMVWGLAAGVVAGMIGGSTAVVLHWPTSLMIGWIAAVAHHAASLPLGELHARELYAVVFGAALVAAARPIQFSGVKRVGAVMMAAGVLAPAAALQASPPARVVLTPGATLWRAGATVLELDGRADAARVLEGLRRAGVTDLDLVICRTSASSVRATVEALRRRYDLQRVLSPSSVSEPLVVSLGQLRVDLQPIGDGLGVDVTLESVGRARGPPV